MVPDPSARRLLVSTLIGSVVIGALLGIAVILHNKWGWYEVRVLLTTVIIAAASLCGLACDLARTPMGRNVLPRTGLYLSITSGILLLLGAWDVFGSWDQLWRITVCLSIMTLALVHVSLLSIVPLAARFRWVYLLTTQVSFGLAGILCLLTLELRFNHEPLFRLIAVLAIVDAALSLVIPLLSRLSKMDSLDAEPWLGSVVEQRNLAEIDDQLAYHRSQIAQLEKLRSELTSTSSAKSQPTGQGSQPERYPD